MLTRKSDTNIAKLTWFIIKHGCTGSWLIEAKETKKNLSEIADLNSKSFDRNGHWMSYKNIVNAFYLSKILSLGVLPVSHRYQKQEMSNCMRFPTMWYVRSAKPQISLRICAVWSEPLLVVWVFYDCLATDWTPFGVSKLKMRLQGLIWVYKCQNANLLEISCICSNNKPQVGNSPWLGHLILCFHFINLFKICEPWGGTILRTRDKIWTHLVEVYKVIPHVKYLCLVVSTK